MLLVPDTQRFRTRKRNWAAAGCWRTASIVANSVGTSTPLHIGDVVAVMGCSVRDAEPASPAHPTIIGTGGTEALEPLWRSSGEPPRRGPPASPPRLQAPDLGLSHGVHIAARRRRTKGSAMHPQFTAALATDHRDDLRRVGDAQRLVDQAKQI